MRRRARSGSGRRLLAESMTAAITSSGWGQTRPFGDVGSMSGLRESGHGWAIYEYTPHNTPCASYGLMPARVGSQCPAAWGHTSRKGRAYLCTSSSMAGAPGCVVVIRAARQKVTERDGASALGVQERRCDKSRPSLGLWTRTSTSAVVMTPLWRL